MSSTGSHATLERGRNLLSQTTQIKARRSVASQGKSRGLFPQEGETHLSKLTDACYMFFTHSTYSAVRLPALWNSFPTSFTDKPAWIALPYFLSKTSRNRSCLPPHELLSAPGKIFLLNCQARYWVPHRGSTPGVLCQQPGAPPRESKDRGPAWQWSLTAGCVLRKW